MINMETVLAAPNLPNFYMHGHEHITGNLFFSPDERYLVSEDGTNNDLVVWNIEERRPIYDSSVSILAAAMSPESDGCYVLTETGIMFLRFRPDGCDEETVASFSLEGCAEAEIKCTIYASKERIVAGSRFRVFVVEAADPAHPKQYCLPLQFDECSTRVHRTRCVDGQIIIDLLDINYDASPSQDHEWHYRGVLFPANETFHLAFQCNSNDVAYAYDDLFLAVPSRPEGRVLGFAPSATSPVKEWKLRLSPQPSQLHLSPNGYIIGEQTESELTFWNLGVEYRKLSIDAQVTSVRIANDGCRCALLYYQLDQSPVDRNVTGFIDLSTKEVIGWSKDHVHGFMGPCAFSPSGTYFASLIIDNTSIGHPSGLSSGTVVVTCLKPNGAKGRA